VGAGDRPRTARRYWSIGAVVGIIGGTLILLAGDRFGHHGVRLLGALIMAAGCLCAVVRAARDFPPGS
jgi:drug/metabolite transporter (DMT)-like permease